MNMEMEVVFNIVSDNLAKYGFSDSRIVTATAAVILGGRIVSDIHGASQEVLQTVYKVEAGKTPRTVADLESGRVGKEIIRQQFPNSRINEEETGDEKGSDGNAFHFDPLDGTSSYARNLRYSTVGISVYENGQPLASAICHPFEKELVIAQVGKGTHLFRYSPMEYLKQLEVSTQSLTGGLAYIDALFSVQTSTRKLGLMADLVKLANNNLGVRMSGSNIDQQLKVAKGSAELTLTDAVGGFFDLAAGALPIIEAGGRFTDRNGNPITELTQVALGTNGIVHDDVLELVGKHYSGYPGFNK